ncbi:hypothetical protein SASPL_106753 [Salvia splendens]|uniref:Probable magnesium transporter n=1 Tax=Salvia splendens TaxID=180675 RepID=A0A8X9AAJ4_SALSN|nr:hypothetical protein SASPL_106753 [Salvia splendens]
MSFQDVGIGSKPTPAANNPSESQAVAAALFQANTALAAFRRLVDAIGTSKDTPDHRLKLFVSLTRNHPQFHSSLILLLSLCRRSTRQRILDLVKDASAKLKSLTESHRPHDLHPNRKVQDSKLAKDLQTTLQEFQKLQHLASERESKFSPVLPLPSSITICTPDDQYAESTFERENDDSFLMEQKRQEIRLLDNDVAFNEAVIEEREYGIEEIQGQVREVNEMFKDLAVLVNEQSRTVDDIEHGIEVSAVSTTQAKLQLSKASKSGNSKTSWHDVFIVFGATDLFVVRAYARERHSSVANDGTNGKAFTKHIIHFQTWRIGIIFFILGNSLNFISFGYAAQSLLAALGSVQFVSNIAFAFFVLNKTVAVKVLIATAFIVLGNIFLVAFGNHQSPVYTPEQLAEKYGNTTFLIYCLILVIVVILSHSMYRRGELMFAMSGHEIKPYWQMLLPLSYALVSGAIGSCSIKSSKVVHVKWMARLNEGLSLFDAILIVPMFQIVWTFFSICTGFVYFQEYQVFDSLRTTMFILGMVSVFIGISLLAPDEVKVGDVKDTPLVSVTTADPNDADRYSAPSEESSIKDLRSLVQTMRIKLASLLTKTKGACSLPFGLGDESINASSVLVMPMVSSKITGFRGHVMDRSKFFSFRHPGWSRIDEEDDDEALLQSSTLLPQSIK